MKLGKAMTYRILIVILCATTTSLFPMESSIKTIIGKFTRSKTHHTPLNNTKKNAFILPPSTFFKKLPLLAHQCGQYNTPKEIKQYIQQLFYVRENEKLLNSGIFYTNWQAFKLNPFEYHCLNDKQLEILQPFLTSTPCHFPSQESYKLFLKIIPNSIQE